MIRTIKFDVERVFDVVKHRISPETKNAPYTGFGKGIALKPGECDELISKSIQAFVHGVGDFDKGGLVQVQAFAGSSDLPTLTSDIFDVFVQTNNYDLAWAESFKSMRLNKGQLFWEISDVSSGLEFKEIPEGGKVELAKFSGSTQTVHVKKYGAGLGITWEIVEGNKLYAFAERLEAVRDKLYKKWADVHYGLLATAGQAHGTAWQGAGTDRTIDRDIATINLAASTIATACKDLGFGDTANVPMILYAGPALRSRIDAALTAVRGSAALSTGKGNSVEWPITARYTFNSAVGTNKAELVLPGQKIQNAVYLRELGLSRQEIESLSEIRTYWTAFGAAVGETNQASELSFA